MPPPSFLCPVPVSGACNHKSSRTRLNTKREKIKNNKSNLYNEERKKEREKRPGPSRSAVANERWHIKTTSSAILLRSPMRRPRVVKGVWGAFVGHGLRGKNRRGCLRGRIIVPSRGIAVGRLGIGAGLLLQRRKNGRARSVSRAGPVSLGHHRSCRIWGLFGMVKP